MRNLLVLLLLSGALSALAASPTGTVTVTLPPNAAALRGECFKKGHEATEDAEKVKWFKKAIELCREDEKIPKAWAYNNIGFTYIRNNKWDEALPMMEKSVEENDKIDVAWNNLGIVYENLFYSLKEKEKKREFLVKALAAYEKAIALKPDMEKYSINKYRVAALIKATDEGKKPEGK